jgi:hypothetical protein
MPALDDPRIPGGVRRFVGQPLEVTLRAAAHEVASSFCHGRENEGAVVH